MDDKTVETTTYRSIEHRKLVITLDFQGTGIPMTMPRDSGADLDELRDELRKKLGR